MVGIGGYRKLCEGIATALRSTSERLNSATATELDPDARWTLVTQAWQQLDSVLGVLDRFSGRFPISPTRIATTPWATALIDRLERAAEPMRLELECDAHAPEAVWLDGPLIERALFELLHNSKAAGAHKLRIAISAEYESLRGPVFAIEVSDDGPGIPTRFQEQATLPFIGEPATRPGIGLSYVSGVVHAHGGQLQLGATLGEGTTVTIRLPLGAPKAEVKSGGGKTILVVDDEVLTREAVRRVLSTAGYSILQANGGDEALELIHQPGQTIDLILCDVNMPVMSGFELHQRLQEEGCPLQMMFMCGYPAETLSDVPPGVELIDKPFTHQELTASIRRHLDARGVSREPGIDER